MPLILPRGSRKAEITEPKLLLILSSTKTGKTSNAMTLPNHLLIDLEDRAKFYDGNPLGFNEIVEKEGRPKDILLEEIISEIKKTNKKDPSLMYDYIIVDTITALEDIAKIRALREFKASIIGKSKNYANIKDVCTEIPKGGGYAQLANSFKYYINLFDGLARKSVILLGHKKVNVKEENGVEVEVTDLDLLGNNKKIVFQQADAIGHLYRTRKKPNTNILSFKKTNYDTIWGSRPNHLRNKQFVFSTYDESSDKLQCHWHLIFPSLNNFETTNTIIDVEDEYGENVTVSEIASTSDIPDQEEEFEDDFELEVDED